MARLLYPADFDDLRAQPGFSRGMMVRLRKQRSRVFEGYLNSLMLDFDRAMQLGNAIALRDRATRPELHSRLRRARRQFARSLLMTRWRLSLYSRLGLGSIRAEDLIAPFEMVGSELHSAGMPVLTP